MYLITPSYANFLVYFLISTVLALSLLLVPRLLAPKSTVSEKLSAYECGFEPFAAPSEVFESHFIIVAVLFIIFDLEILFLYPWTAASSISGAVGFWTMMAFLVLLSVGLFYEWRRGALVWPIFFTFQKEDFFVK